jgi:threonyl-tRNA synthetase
MVGFYRLIDENGAENEIAIDSFKKEKEIYNTYFKKNNKEPNNINIENMSYSPIYVDKDLECFSKLKNIIEKNIKEKLNVNEIKTPNILENNERFVELQKLFGLEQFICNNNYILPPASDFAVFEWFKGRDIVKKEIPYRIYEFAKCYRIEEKEKQTNVLKRPTSFHLPDIHVFHDEGSYEECLKHLQIYDNVLNELDIKHDLALRITEEEYNFHKDKIIEISKKLNKKMIVNVVPSSIKYWESKFKYIYIDSQEDVVQLSTVQVDYRTSKLFNIKIEGEYAKIIHSSIGSMERVMYAYLDKYND